MLRVTSGRGTEWVDGSAWVSVVMVDEFRGNIT